MNVDLATMPYDERRKSIWSSLYTLKEALPGLLAMFFIAIFANNLAGVPNPFTLQNLFLYLDEVIGPVNGQHFFQIMNTNFVWNSFLLGLLIGNIFGVPNSWKRGLSYIHKFMPLGIVMLAPHFIVGHAMKAGIWPIMIALFFLFFTASITLFFARFLKVDDRHASVLAGGLCSGDPHVCAILMPSIKARGGQVINAVVSVILFGIIAGWVLPWFCGLFNLPDPLVGLASVIAIGNGAQAFSGAFAYSYEAGRHAVFYDVVRHVIMPSSFLYVFIVMFIRRIKFRKNDDSVMATRGVDSFPLYLTVFIIGWILACMHIFYEPAHHAIFNMVQWDFSLAAGALGLCMNWKEIWQWGKGKGFALACIAGTVRMVGVVLVLYACAQMKLFDF